MGSRSEGIWEAQASKPGSPDRTTDHTPMRTTNTAMRPPASNPTGELHAPTDPDRRSAQPYAARTAMSQQTANRSFANAQRALAMYQRGLGVLALMVPPKTQMTASVKGPNVQRAFLLPPPLSVSTLPWAHRHIPGGQVADE
nr:MAG TPA: hypothetical protein [Caudoviricetes sp.]